MRTKRVKNEGKEKAIFIIVNLILSTIAFSFLIGLADVGVVSGVNEFFDPGDELNAGGGVNVADAGGFVVANPVGPPSMPMPTSLSADYWVQQGVYDSSFVSGGGLTGPVSQVVDKAGSQVVQKAATDTASKGILDSIMGDGIVGSLVWAGGLGLGAYFISGMFGETKDNQKAWGLAVFGGVLTYQLANPLLSGKGITSFLTGNQALGVDPVWAAKGGAFGGGTQLVSLGIGVGVGLLILNALYKTKSAKMMTFQCSPFEPPTGGQYCELCNKDKSRPCSEYRCKSLGQACDIVPGKEGDMCVWKNPMDVLSATIEPWKDILTKDHAYTNIKTRPPGTGMSIVKLGASDGCIKAFTPLTFGIATNKPTMCKIDYNHTVSVRDVKNAFSSMQYYFGESNLYAYNHSQTLRLPGPTALNSSGGIELIHDGTFTLYVRCQDANGNVNEDEFAIRFCVDKGPDTTPPRIEGTNIPSGMPVSFNTNETPIEVYVNEPADCKWSRQDKDYDLMEYNMNCDRNVFDMNSNMLYKCKTTLDGLENRKDNNFFFRCRDQPYAPNQNDRYTNQESYPFTIKGSQPLNILKVSPNGTIQGYSSVAGVELYLETGNGYNKGEAICYYSQTTDDASYIKMFETGTNKHKQRQDLAAGTYTYYFKCVDLGGNTDFNSTTFSVAIDRQAPQVVRVYGDGGNLKIISDEKSTCSYSTAINQKCNFDMASVTNMPYSNSTEHYAEWKANTNYYIKCADANGNQPNPTDCSIVVRLYNSFAK